MEHTVKAYSEELNNLTAEVVRLGGLAEAQVADSIVAFARRDLTVAQDLRRTVSAMKFAMQLERCGDLAKNIAKRCLVLAEAEPLTPLTRSIERMGNLVAARLKDVLDAYTSGNLDRAVAVWARDDEVDEHYNSLFRELLTYMMADPRTINSCAHLLFIAKNLERIGDHATNIAETVHYLISGTPLTDERPKKDTSPMTSVEYKRA